MTDYKWIFSVSEVKGPWVQLPFTRGAVWVHAPEDDLLPKRRPPKR